MPDNPTPAAKPGSNSDPAEFNFDKPATESPRIKRRSLKAKASGLQPATAPPAAARELEREAPPLSTATAPRPATPVPDARETKVGAGAVPKSTPVAPPRTTPAVSGTAATSATMAQKPVTVSTAAPVNGSGHHPADTATASEKPTAQKPATVASSSQPAAATGQKVNIALTSTQKASATPQPSATSPHGTRPATLYYSSYPKKSTSPSMKPTTTASATATPTSSSSSNPSASTASAARPATGAAAPASAARPATTAAAPTTATRPASVNIDYRANVERQSREQKSVGSILSYFVYGLIAIFLFGAGLATYGAVVIFGRLNDQSVTLNDLDAKYALKVSEINKQLATEQDTLIQAQAQLGREQDLVTKQEEELNQLRAALNAASSASGEAIKTEIRARTQEAAVLRARLRDLEYRTTTTTNQKY